MRMFDGSVLDSPEEVHESAIKHFEIFLTEQVHREHPDLAHLILSVITADENNRFLNISMEEELKKVVHSIPIDNSHGLDGFGASFFISFWDFINEDLLEATITFFGGATLSKFFSISFIVLILKVDKRDSFEKFRPIRLCSVVYEILSKMVVRRFARYLDRMISVEQGTFIKGRNILENIFLAQEMLNSLHKKTTGENVMLKVDMAKAYDRVV